MLGDIKRSLLKFVVRCEFSALRLFSSKFRYQPMPRGLSSLGPNLGSARACEDRLVIIKNHLPQNSRNILDIGSNSGYYLVQLAELGYICHGLEPDPDLVHFTSLVMYLLNSKGVSCECGKLTLSYVQGMPCYDVVLCLSVVHHIILAEGIDVAKEIIEILALKTNHVMFFEMGQSNEIKADWSQNLPKMEPNPEIWISRWLKKCGFKRVETIGTSSTTVSRFLFAAYPHD